MHEGRLCSEMLALYQSDGIIAEPAGALATASLGHSVRPEPGSTVVCVLSGGNNDISRYAEILERSLVFEEAENRLHAQKALLVFSMIGL